MSALKEVERILRITDVTRATGLSRSTIYNEIAMGRFPRAVQLSTRTVGWRISAVQEWIESREQAATTR
ncbi:MAG: AlpA family phage regulatory protein [Xanthomonadales bacterium]|nr:AlpA family phage regulatory protein [Xanthomonadales bacterium]